MLTLFDLIPLVTASSFAQFFAEEKDGEGVEGVVERYYSALCSGIEDTSGGMNSEYPRAAAIRASRSFIVAVHCSDSLTPSKETSSLGACVSLLRLDSKIHSILLLLLPLLCQISDSITVASHLTIRKLLSSSDSVVLQSFILGSSLPLLLLLSRSSEDEVRETAYDGFVHIASSFIHTSSASSSPSTIIHTSLLSRLLSLHDGILSIFLLSVADGSKKAGGKDDNGDDDRADVSDVLSFSLTSSPLRAFLSAHTTICSGCALSEELNEEYTFTQRQSHHLSTAFSLSRAVGN